MITNTQIVDDVDFVNDNRPPFVDPPLYPTLLLLLHLPLLPQPGINIVRCPLIQDPCTQFLLL